MIEFTRYMKCALFCFLMALYGCDINSVSAPSISESLIKGIKVDGLERVDEFIGEDWDMVCVLVPYQNILRDTDDKKRQKINERIHDLDLAIGEGNWHILLIKEEEVVAQSIDRSKMFDIKQAGFSHFMKLKFSKAQFIPSSCEPFDKAVFFKFVEDKRIYITLGGRGK